MDPSAPGTSGAPADDLSDEEIEPSPTAPAGFARLARDSALFTLGSVAGKVVAVVIVPVVARLLEPADFGRLDIMSTLATAITSVAVLGFDIAATRLYPDLDVRGRRHMFGTWAAVCGAIGIGVLALTAALSVVLSDLFFDTSAYAIGFVFVGVYVGGNLFQVLGLTVLRNQGRPLTYAVVSSATFLVGGVLTIVLVAWHPTANSAIAAIAIGMVAGGLAAVIAGRSLVFGRPSKPAWQGLWRLGMPLIPALIATWFGEFINRTILLAAAGADEVGYFSIAVRFGSVGLLMVTGFQLAWHPHAFGLGQDDAAMQRIAADSRRIIVATAVAVVPIALLAPELVRLVGGLPYLPAVPAVGLLLVQSIAFALYLVATMGSALVHRMRDLGLSATVGALLGIAVNVWFAHLWGSTGTAAAIAIGQTVSFLIAAYLGIRASTAYPLVPDHGDQPDRISDHADRHPAVRRTTGRQVGVGRRVPRVPLDRRRTTRTRSLRPRPLPTAASRDCDGTLEDRSQGQNDDHDSS